MKGFFSQMNSIKITLWIKSIIYSLNALLLITMSGLTFSQGTCPETSELLLQHQETLTQRRQVQGVQKTKIRYIKVTTYWFFKSFVRFFQIGLLWQPLINMNGNMQITSFNFFKFCWCFYCLGNILFHTLFEFLNY